MNHRQLIAVNNLGLRRDGPFLKLSSVTAAAVIASFVSAGLCFHEVEWHWLCWGILLPLAWALAAGSAAGLMIGTLGGAVACHLLSLEFIRTPFGGSVAWAWITLSVVASVPCIVVLYLSNRLLRLIVLPMSIMLPLAWVAMEYVRMYFVSLFSEVPFPYSQLGTLAIDSRHLIQCADVGGVFALSWIVASINGIAYDLVTVFAPAARGRLFSVYKTLGAVGFSFTVTAGAWIYGEWRLSQEIATSGPTVVLVPSSIDQYLQPDRADRLRSQIVDVAGDGQPDLLVFSEAAYSQAIVTERATPAADNSTARHDFDVRHVIDRGESVRPLEVLCSRVGGAILTGCKRDEIDRAVPITRRYNSLAFVSADHGYLGCYDKVYLVPWREFQPRVAAVLGMLPDSPSDVAYAGLFSPGKDMPAFLLRDEEKLYRIGCSICFEVSYSSLHRRYMLRGDDGSPDFFVGCANESAFSGPLYARLSLDAQRLRAIECRRAFARVALSGISAFVDGNGEVLRAESMGRPSDFLVCRVPIDQRKSLYVAWGDWLPISACVALAALTAFAARRRICGATTGPPS